MRGQRSNQLSYVPRLNLDYGRAKNLLFAAFAPVRFLLFPAATKPWQVQRDRSHQHQ